MVNNISHLSRIQKYIHGSLRFFNMIRIWIYCKYNKFQADKKTTGQANSKHIRGSNLKFSPCRNSRPEVFLETSQKS